MKCAKLITAYILTLAFLLDLGAILNDLDRRERGDRELIAALVHNQEMAADLLRLRAGQ